jgi:hypothetical protein
VHRISRGGILLGTVHAYDKGLRMLGLGDGKSIPLNVSELIGEKGGRLLEALSAERQRRGYSLEAGTSPAEGAGISLGGYDWSPQEESFRVYTMRWNDGAKDRMVDVKIPGEDNDHFNVEYMNFEAGVRVYQEYLKYDETPLIACPLVFVNIPSRFSQKLYGKERPNFSPNIFVREHLDGMRLLRQGKAINFDREIIPRQYVESIANATGVPPRELYVRCMRAYYSVLGYAHKAGYILASDRHQGNMVLCADGTCKGCPTSGTAAG